MVKRKGKSPEKSSEEYAAIISGRKGLLEILKHEPRKVREVVVAENSRLDPVLAGLLETRCAQGLTVRSVEKEELNEIVGSVRHQGMAALLKRGEEAGFEQVAAAGLNEDGGGIILVLDQIVDPQNLGALFRAAEVFGASAVIYTKDRSAPLSAAARKASAGASELIPLHAAPNLARVLKLLKARGYWIVGAALGAEAELLDAFPLRFPAALVLGSEGRGLRKLTKDSCDVLVQIPMYGRIESLNVSQAASVFLFELRRRKAALQGAKEGI